MSGSHEPLTGDELGQIAIECQRRLHEHPVAFS